MENIKLSVDSYDVSGSYYVCHCEHSLMKSEDDHLVRLVEEEEILNHLKANALGLILFEDEDKAAYITLQEYLNNTSRDDFKEILADIINRKECRTIHVSKPLNQADFLPNNAFTTLLNQIDRRKIAM